MMILTLDNNIRKELYFNIDFYRKDTVHFFVLTLADTEDAKSILVTLRGRINHLSPPDVPSNTIIYQLGEIDTAMSVSPESYAVIQSLITNHTLLALFAGKFMRQYQSEMSFEFGVDVSAAMKRSCLMIHSNVLSILGDLPPDLSIETSIDEWFSPRKDLISDCVRRLQDEFVVTSTRSIIADQLSIH